MKTVGEHVRTFDKVLVANRGEIARRILRALRELGIASVAVYSDADAGAPWAAEADEAVRIGSAASADSYLNIERILQAARATGAGAIHPGYGFLSERAEFAQRCQEAGLVFIGPSADAIRRMGSKIESKLVAAQAGVAVLEGFSCEGLSESAIAARARELGFPLLIKASAGGGGRGMRIVYGEQELDTALAAAGREAIAAFGDGALLVERYVEAPRHVEIQIFGDAYGNAIHIFERECSIQRRHQKVIEEAPSPAVDAALRARMGAAAVNLCRAMGYQGAGTVELLLDRSGAFYFLEVNTRLQVEHPVTEAISGLDLVRMQIEVAQGLPLAVTQDQLRISGHAIEARLYAEDPERDFLPVTGRVTMFRPPPIPGLRIDSGVQAGSEVSVHYDPMLAKVIARGPTREHARRVLIRGLRELGVGGLTTNRDFLLKLLEHPAFAAAELDTHFIDRHLPKGSRRPTRDGAIARTHVIAAALYLYERRRAADGPLPASIPSGFRNNRSRLQQQRFTLDSTAFEVRYLARTSNAFEIEVDGTDDAAPAGEAGARTEVLLIDSDAEFITLEIDRVRRRFAISSHGEQLTVHGAGSCSELKCVPRFPIKSAAQIAGGCVAPMTGLVCKLHVAVGSRVQRGDLLLVIEAMKMEHRLLAHADGIVKEVRVREGQMVDPDHVLVVIDEVTEPKDGG